MTILVGVTGAKGSGKDHFFKTVAAYLNDRKVRKLAFADPIKDYVCHLFDLTGENEYDEFKRTTVSFTVGGKRRISSGRHIVREIGMMMRMYDESQFVHNVNNIISKAEEEIYIITDLRFKNELKFLQDKGGFVVKIDRVGIDYDGHITESEFDDELCDFVIHNRTNEIEQYERECQRVIDFIIRTKNKDVKAC